MRHQVEVANNLRGGERKSEHLHPTRIDTNFLFSEPSGGFDSLLQPPLPIRMEIHDVEREMVSCAYRARALTVTIQRNLPFFLTHRNLLLSGSPNLHYV